MLWSKNWPKPGSFKSFLKHNQSPIKLWPIIAFAYPALLKSSIHIIYGAYSFVFKGRERKRERDTERELSGRPNAATDLQ